MRLLILGVGDAFTASNFHSGALLHAPEGPVLIDCGHLPFRALAEAAHAASDPTTHQDIHNVLLTHLHADHAGGLEPLGFRRYAERLRGAGLPRPTIHTHDHAADRLWEMLAPAMDAPLTPGAARATLDDFFKLRRLDHDKTNTVAGLSVELRFTEHPVPTTALRISDGRRTLAWSSDTRFDPDLVDWLAPADLIVHECNRPPIHTAPDELAALPKNLRDKMRLIHLPDDHDPDALPIPPLRAGELLQV